MTVYLRQTHLDNGVLCDCLLCPIALALHDATGVEWQVSWAGDLLKPHLEARHVQTGESIRLPDECAEFADDWDRVNNPVPFSFEFPWEQKGKIPS